MKLLTPTIKDCRYIHRKLKEFYKENKDIGEGTPINRKEFNRVIKRFCDFYNCVTPRIEWYIEIDCGNTLGKIFFGHLPKPKQKHLQRE